MDHKEQRQPGFYWVKYAGGWIVSKWVRYQEFKWWSKAGSDDEFDDSDFEEIDENRIERPEPYNEQNEIQMIQSDRDIYGQSFEMLKDGKIYRVDPTKIRLCK